MRKLDESTAYLSGSMEMVADHGVEWRRKFIRLSNEAGLGVHYIDPTNKPGNINNIGNIDEDKGYQELLQKEGRFEELKAYVAKYRREDLRYVDISDFLIASITPSVAQWGTSNEIYEAEKQHKPRFAIISSGLRKLPRWLFDVFNLEDIFEKEEDVIDRLIKLDNGELPLDKRWVLVRKHIQNQRN
jgi:hypothetical protein